MAGPPENETPVVSIGGGAGILLTNTIVATARHVVPVDGSTVTGTTASGESVQGTTTLYYVPSGAAEVPAGADFAVVKLDKAVSVYSDPNDYEMELYTWPTTGLIGKTTVRYGSAGFDEWGRSGVPIWSFDGKVSVTKVDDSLVSVSGQLFTDLFNPFPAGDGSTHW